MKKLCTFDNNFRARGLTDCASYDTLAKLTRPQHLSTHNNHQVTV